MALRSISNAAGALLGGVGEMKAMSMATLAEGALNLLLSMALAPRLGLAGVALASVLARSSAFQRMLMREERTLTQRFKMAQRPSARADKLHAPRRHRRQCRPRGPLHFTQRHRRRLGATPGFPHPQLQR